VKTYIPGIWVPAAYRYDGRIYMYSEWFCSWAYIRCSRFTKQRRPCANWARMIELRKDELGMRPEQVHPLYHTHSRDDELRAFTGRAWCEPHSQQHFWERTHEDEYHPSAYYLHA
jgi:hypothetical protein